jgi:hypothetical protein
VLDFGLAKFNPNMATGDSEPDGCRTYQPVHLDPNQGR